MEDYRISRQENSMVQWLLLDEITFFLLGLKPSMTMYPFKAMKNNFPSDIIIERALIDS